MTLQRARRTEMLFGAILLAAVMWAVFDKTQRGVADELLWACYPFAALAGCSLMLGWRNGIAVAAIFALTTGTWVWIINVAVTGESSVSSFIVHMITPVFTTWALRGRRVSMRHGAVVLAFTHAMVPLARLVCAPELNVMLSQHPYVDLGVSLAVYGLLNALLQGALIVGCVFGLNRVLPKFTPRE